MHSFVKNVLPLLFLLLTFSDTLASTILDGVELDSGYRNDFTHMNWNSAGVGGGWCECCRTAYSNFRESEGTEDWYVTWTYQVVLM